MSTSMSSIARQVTADQMIAYQQAAEEVTRPVFRHLAHLMSLGAPRFLVKDDGTFEVLEHVYPEGFTELIEQTRQLILDLRQQVARSMELSLIYP